VRRLLLGVRRTSVGRRSLITPPCWAPLPADRFGRSRDDDSVRRLPCRCGVLERTRGANQKSASQDLSRERGRLAGQAKRVALSWTLTRRAQPTTLTSGVCSQRGGPPGRARSSPSLPTSWSGCWRHHLRRQQDALSTLRSLSKRQNRGQPGACTAWR